MAKAHVTARHSDATVHVRLKERAEHPLFDLAEVGVLGARGGQVGHWAGVIGIAVEQLDPRIAAVLCAAPVLGIPWALCTSSQGRVTGVKRKLEATEAAGNLSKRDNMFWAQSWLY